MQEIISLFTGQYALTRKEVVAEIEKVISEILSRRYGCEVLAVFGQDLQLEAVAYNGTGGIIQQRIVDLKNIRGRISIKRQLEKSLQKASILKQTRQYKYYERELRWGEITSIDYGKGYYIETELVPGEPITAVCPFNRVGLHERSLERFSVGMKRAFHVRRVDPVTLSGTPRLKVTVDRVSKTLVETLLIEHLGVSAEKMTIRCTKRYVGQKSFVVTSRRIPKSAIVAVTRELNEQVQVRYDRSV